MMNWSFKFAENSQIDDWRVVDDVVMGGRSIGSFELNGKGHGVFSGRVSLENNGGFSSLRYRFSTVEINNFKTLHVRIKGDGKIYQFRTKSSRFDRHAYVYFFETTGEWQTIEIPLSKMTPRFRGRQLNMANYPAKKMEEIAFLISNKKEEKFQLQIAEISLL